MGKRKAIQIIWAVLTNAYLAGFASGRIFQGPFKFICVPGMNCYSCPGALGSCPIGALQAFFGSVGQRVSLYVCGFLVLIGALFGRFVCGWLCPFGLIQELLNKIPFIKKITTFRGDFLLRKLKYVVLILFVIILPMFFLKPYFCELICPVGTLEAGIPLALLSEGIRAAIGFLYTWKVIILVVMILLSIMIYRPFCRYICPLGAVYSLFNPISITKYNHNTGVCSDCGSCKKSCGMNLDPVRQMNHPECVHCGSCKKNCPNGAIYRYKSKSKEVTS